MTIKTTEREVTSWLSQKINEILNSGGYPFRESTVETSLKEEGSLFPDIIIWKSRKAKDSFAFFEIKTPGGKEDLSKIKEKAKRLKAKYCITWDFNEGILYKIEGVSASKIKIYPTYLMRTIEDWKRKDIQAKIRRSLIEFLFHLESLYERGHIHDFIPDKLFFIDILRESIDTLYPYFVDHLKNKIKNKKTKKEIDAWALKQGIATSFDETFYETLARQWVYSLVTKIIFYLTLKKHFPDLPELYKDPSSPQPIENLLRYAFCEARKIDWHAVFKEGIIERIGIPDSAEDSVFDLLKELKAYSFGMLKEDVIGEIFEELIPHNERHSLGQYFTREDLVDFIIGFVAESDHEGCYCDPTCGSGTFLNRLYSRIRWLSGYRKFHKDVLNQIWGIDIAKFPAELATINLFRQKVSDYSNFPRIIVKDFFEVKKGEEFEFPPSRIDREHAPFSHVKEKIPQFCGLVGNFPYIRQELIERKVPGYKKFLTKVIGEELFFEFPEFFKTKRMKTALLEHINNNSSKKQAKEIERLVEEGHIDLKLSGQADIYTYLFFHTAKFLKENGRLGFITSNSWLDVAYGTELKKFFLKKFKIIAIVGSWVEPWFPKASVNTIFTILELCDNEDERNNHNVKFVKLEKTLEELIPYRNLKLEEPERWRKIDALVREIEYAGRKYWKQEGTKFVNYLEGVQLKEDEKWSIRMVRQSELIKELEEKEKLAKWGKYMRAPEVYFEILEKVKDKIVPLKEVADVRRGYTTGINDFFYLKSVEDKHIPLEEPFTKTHPLTEYIMVENGRGWIGRIEKEFLKPVIKSPKESKKIVIDPDKLNHLIFICNRSKKDLKLAGKIGALRYIEWGEMQRTKAGMLWYKVPSVKGRKYWWGIGEKTPWYILMQMVNNDRFVIFYNKEPVQVDHNLFEFNISKDLIELYIGIMNSSFFALIREVVSRVNLGDGATKTEGIDWKNVVFLPDPSLIPPRIRKKIIKAFDKLNNRPIKSIFEEVKMKDRKKLDEAVLEALELDPKEYLPKIYDGLTELVKERLQLPKMRKKQINNKKRISIEQIKKHIEKEMLSGGVREFPDAFIDKEYLNFRNAKDIVTTGKRLHIGGEFFGSFEVIDEDNQKIWDAEGLEVAKFLVYSYKPRMFILKIPEDRKVIKESVWDYERYVKELKRKLTIRIYEATFNHSQAEKIAQEIMEECVRCAFW